MPQSKGEKNVLVTITLLVFACNLTSPISTKAGPLYIPSIGVPWTNHMVTIY